MTETEQESDVNSVLQTWSLRAKVALDAHYHTASVHDRYNRVLGGAVAALGVFLAVASAYPAISSLFGGALVVFAGAFVAAGTMWHTHMNLSERSVRHKTSAARYASVRRHIAELNAFRSNMGEPEVQGRVQRIRERLDAIAEEAPSIPRKIWERVNRDNANKTSLT